MGNNAATKSVPMLMAASSASTLAFGQLSNLPNAASKVCSRAFGAIAEALMVGFHSAGSGLACRPQTMPAARLLAVLIMIMIQRKMRVFFLMPSMMRRRKRQMDVLAAQRTATLKSCASLSYLRVMV